MLHTVTKEKTENLFKHAYKITNSILLIQGERGKMTKNTQKTNKQPIWQALAYLENNPLKDTGQKQITVHVCYHKNTQSSMFALFLKTLMGKKTQILH